MAGRKIGTFSGLCAWGQVRFEKRWFYSHIHIFVFRNLLKKGSQAQLEIRLFILQRFCLPTYFLLLNIFNCSHPLPFTMSSAMTIAMHLLMACYWLVHWGCGGGSCTHLDLDEDISISLSRLSSSFNWPIEDANIHYFHLTTLR